MLTSYVRLVTEFHAGPRIIYMCVKVVILMGLSPEVFPCRIACAVGSVN
jgi:hypothetical protein